MFQLSFFFQFDMGTSHENSAQNTRSKLQKTTNMLCLQTHCAKSSYFVNKELYEDPTNIFPKRLSVLDQNSTV